MKLHRFTSMGCEIIVSGAAGLELQVIEKLFAERDQRFSRFRADSELNRVNGTAVPFLVSQEFASALDVRSRKRPPRRTASSIPRWAVPWWRPATTATLQTSRIELNRARARAPRRAAGGRCASTGRLLTRPHGVQLDLNGVVKALAVDEALVCIAGRGFVSAGGDLRLAAP